MADLRDRRLLEAGKCPEMQGEAPDASPGDASSDADSREAGLQVKLLVPVQCMARSEGAADVHVKGMSRNHAGICAAAGAHWDCQHGS